MPSSWSLNHKAIKHHRMEKRGIAKPNGTWSTVKADGGGGDGINSSVILTYMYIT